MTRWQRFGIGVALSLSVGLTACSTTTPQHAPATVASAPTSGVAAKSCDRPAPTTAKGYAAMFARTPLDQWGGGDTAVSVTTGHRRVWLFSDTLTANRFVHSSAIVQTGGCLRVSHRGAQLLPNDGAGWYWIESAQRFRRSGLRISAVQVRPSGTGPWDFATGRARYAVATISAAGDVTFSRWLPGTHRAAVPVGTLRRVAPGRVSYGRVVHRDVPVRGGFLVTVCRNWDDGHLHPARTYAPAFSVSR